MHCGPTQWILAQCIFRLGSPSHSSDCLYGQIVCFRGYVWEVGWGLGPSFWLWNKLLYFPFSYNYVHRAEMAFNIVLTCLGAPDYYSLISDIMEDCQMFTDLHSKEILSAMNSLRKANKLCDVILRVDNKCFPAHRIVLAASSDYFCAMFTNGVSLQLFWRGRGNLLIHITHSLLFSSTHCYCCCRISF